MNYIIYGKFPDEKRFGAMNLKNGRVGVGLIYATLISNLEKAKSYADELPRICTPDMTFQVRIAGKSKIVYQTGGITQ